MLCRRIHLILCRNLPKYRFTVPNEIRLIGWLSYQSVLISCLTLSLKKKFISFLQNWVLYSTGQENEQKRICTSDFVPAGMERYPLIASNFLFRFTRNVWTTETSTIPFWNWEELNLKGFKIFFSQCSTQVKSIASCSVQWATLAPERQNYSVRLHVYCGLTPATRSTGATFPYIEGKYRICRVN